MKSQDFNDEIQTNRNNKENKKLKELNASCDEVNKLIFCVLILFSSCFWFIEDYWLNAW